MEISQKILENKANIFEHIFYEFSMFLQVNQIKTNDQFLFNILNISQLTQLRNLTEFFYVKSKKKYEHDLCFNDIIDDSLMPSITKEQYDDVMTKVSNSISHLTLNRCKRTTSQELIEIREMMYPLIKNLIQQFMNLLSIKVKEKWKKDFELPYTKELIESINALLKDDKILYLAINN